MRYTVGTFAFVAAALGIFAAGSSDGVLGDIPVRVDPVERVDPRIMPGSELLVLAQASGPACQDRDTMLAALAEHYGEAPRVMALDAQGRVVEITVAGDGTWSFLVTTPDGMTCMLASGTDFMKARAAPLPGDQA